MIELAHPDALRVDRRWVGGTQMWYGQFWQRQSGCGPANASLMVWYLAQTRPEYAALCDAGQQRRQDFQRVMQEMFRYMRPGLRGVDTAEKFMQGLQAYAAARGITLPLREIEAEQIPGTLQSDLPVAFLNLHSGSQRWLDPWHWMTIIACDAQSLQARCCDQGRTLEFSLNEWKKTSRLGGSFVALNIT